MKNQKAFLLVYHYPTSRVGLPLFVYETALWVASGVSECQERSGTLLVEFFA